MSVKLFDTTFGLLERAMDLRLRRHQVLSSNVANAETPNFRARELDFAGELRRMIGEDGKGLMKTDPKHMDLGGQNSAHVVLDNTAPMGADGNNVDLDLAMGKLSDNSQAYESAGEYMTMKLRMIRLAASGGRGGV
ncbi:MAG: flagellar basal body rod protein FlgB [Bdellovibrionales bacterium]|nr:flagellar basal body rod protein FlgB [Bdellovibrionales bacterium]